MPCLTLHGWPPLVALCVQSVACSLLGMTLTSPYASTSAPTAGWYAAMDAFLDSCVAAGFRVNFQLIAYESKPNDAETLASLTAQINRYKSHPAIMSWYLADEPGGQGIKNTSLLPKYKAVRAADETGKPVSMVFCTTQAADYLEMLDVIMVDPYPVPGSRCAEHIAALCSQQCSCMCMTLALLTRPVRDLATIGSQRGDRARRADECRVARQASHDGPASLWWRRELGPWPLAAGRASDDLPGLAGWCQSDSGANLTVTRQLDNYNRSKIFRVCLSARSDFCLVGPVGSTLSATPRECFPTPRLLGVRSG